MCNEAQHLECPTTQWEPVSTLARAMQPPGKHHLPGKCPRQVPGSGTCRPSLEVGICTRLMDLLSPGSTRLCPPWAVVPAVLDSI